MTGALQPLAVLETSFWTAAWRADVAANCLDMFTIVVPDAVEREILRQQDGFPDREYPYATLYRHLRSQFRRPPDDAPPPLSLFGPGEAAAIPLAAQLRAVLLVNEHRANLFARQHGIVTVTVATVVVTLTRRGVISARAAHRKLDQIASITAKPVIEDARRLVDSLQPGRNPMQS